MVLYVSCVPCALAWPHFHCILTWLTLCKVFMFQGQFLHCHTTYVHHLWSKHWLWRLHVNQAYVTWPWPHYGSYSCRLTLLNLCQDFMIRSVSLYSYNLASQYLLLLYVKISSNIKCSCMSISSIYPVFLFNFFFQLIYTYYANLPMFDKKNRIQIYFSWPTQSTEPN